MAKTKKTFILDIETNKLYSILKPFVKEDYRVSQIIQWIYLKKVLNFELFTNISKDIRGNLESSFTLRSFTNIVKDESILDGTIRYTFKTYDNKYIYAVCLPSEGKKTVCISTQVGCPISCNFCLSGKTKFSRNLSRGEILEEILYIENDIKERVSGVLFMGMGEPMLNYKNLTSVIKTLISKKEMNIGKRHITVSSMGIIPAIKNLANEMYGVRFALSLHATDDKQRKKIILNNFDTKITDLLNTCRYYLKKTNSRVTIEYILLKDFNDTSGDAHRLARLMKASNLINPNVQVNLIPYNETNSFDYKTPLQVSILNFKKILKLNGITVNIREPKGLDIGAACGQLGKKINKEGIIMKIALALSGGGARALAHIGVLEVLEQNNIKIDCITGTSMGAIIGALYAIEPSCEKIKTILKDYIFNVMFSKMNMKKMQDAGNVSSTINFEDMINAIIPDIKIEDTKIPFACVATDITNGKEKFFTKDFIRKRVLASASLPEIFPPVNIDNVYYADGLYVNVTPVTATKIFNPDFIIALDVIGELKKMEVLPVNSKDIISRCNIISGNLLYKEQIKDVDVMIRPNIQQTSWTEFNKFDFLVCEGKKAGEQNIREIKLKLKDM